MMGEWLRDWFWAAGKKRQGGRKRVICAELSFAAGVLIGYGGSARIRRTTGTPLRLVPVSARCQSTVGTLRAAV